ncbi:type II toxin-antitoxin system Phd/YefM family antitoxin [Streptomyces sp. LRE541]|uniref:type II toxin-antitoxin system Phd/YefM family antitoxin n=1 Tax=Streptomyces sp. LRE541 TaxID=2931983 RepID=UPI00200F81F4|nr:type II toxin-antitoxin system Phd/YefM family antitoxin [Streptomyces sp. LRE541]UPZ27620.1 type II toxin-antitoxin system Phd/YefM family antitoxin [Streptomyces sp. LRE541]
MDETVKVQEAREQFAQLLNGTQWQDKHIAITRHGKTAAVLVPPDWYEKAQAALLSAES